MTTGEIIDNLAKRLGRIHGEIVTMVVKKALSRVALERMADEFEAFADVIRTLLARKQTQGGVR